MVQGVDKVPRVCHTTGVNQSEDSMSLLMILDFFAEVIHLVFQIGLLTRQYLLPVVVFVYCVIVHYIAPALRIPYYYLMVRRMRLESTYELIGDHRMA